jgi:hypothetical protein
MTVSSNADGWEMSGSYSWNSSYLRLGNWSSGAAYAKRSFYMPADTSVRVKASGSVPSATVSTTFSISVSGSSIYSAKKGDDINCNTTTTMKSTNTEVKLNNSYSAGNSHSRVSSLEITYNL